MVSVVFGSGHEREGSIRVEARTLGEAIAQLDGIDQRELRVFVDGVDAERLEGDDTPVGEEDTVLLTRW